MNTTKKAPLSVIGCSMAIFWSGFLAFGYPGIMSTYWQQRYNVGAAETGTVVTYMLLALAVSMFFCGKIHIKIGMRKCVLIGTLFIAAAMFIQMTVQNIYGAYLWGFMTNIGCSFVYGPGLTTAQQWYPHRRGMASGVLNFVFGIAAAVMSPLWNNILETAGYAKMNVMLLICVLVTNAAAYMLISEPQIIGSAQTGGRDYTVTEALKTKAFWTIWLVWVFMGAAGISMISLSKSYAITLGLSSVVVLTAFNLANGVGRIIAGVLSEIIGGELTGAIIFALAAAGYMILPFTGNSVIILVIAAFIGMAFGTLFTITSPLASGIFGLRNFGMIYGLIFTAYGFIGGIMGPAASGLVLDSTGGNYTIVFIYLAVCALIGAVLMVALKKFCDRIKYQ